MEDIRRRPTLLWFIDDLGLTAQTGMSLLCIIGVYLSVMCIVSKGWRSIFSFSFMWILYFSLYQVGFATFRDGKLLVKNNTYGQLS